MTSSNRRSSRISFVVLATAMVSLLPTSPALASNNHGPYGANAGFLELARRFNGATLNVSSSSSCPSAQSTAEDGAFTNTRTSTAQTSEFVGKWPGGLQLTRTRCDGVVNAAIDIKIKYMWNTTWCSAHGGANNCSTAGGEEHFSPSSPNFCNTVTPNHPTNGSAYPCGTHPSTVEINGPKWQSKSPQDRIRTLMLETAHSQGLQDHCVGAEDSITNSGDPSCNGGRWTEVMAYQPRDRAGIVNVYPGWPLP